MQQAKIFLFCVCWLHVRAETVSTKYGDIDGLLTPYPTASGPFTSVSTFLGVPFAAPPIQDLRFKAPNRQKRGNQRFIRLKHTRPAVYS